MTVLRSRFAAFLAPLGATGLCLALLVGAPPTAEADCTLPPSVNCNDALYGNGRCASCTTEPVSCDFQTGCSLGGCPAGTVEIAATFCFPSFTYNETCRRSGTRTLQTCASCVSNATQYGPYCQQCPGTIGPAIACNGHGTCASGVSGSGLCSCSAGWTGNACQYSRATTCSGHGTPDFNGQCSCDTGYTGASCSQCAASYYDYPTCRYCNASSTCSGHGTCDSSGFCDCSVGFSGSNCQSCGPNYYAYPFCRYCTSSVTCNNRGICDANGNCDCEGNVTGVNCDECISGTWGVSCTPCPGGMFNPCNGFGTCDAGMGGTGTCACNTGYDGPACQFSDAVHCSGHGEVDYDGVCDCEEGFLGPNCQLTDLIFRDDFDASAVAGAAAAGVP